MFESALPDEGKSTARSGPGTRGATGRVAAVHRQARHTLTIAALFVIAAPVAAIAPHRTGPWLPLHLFLVGGLLSAISGVTQLLAVTWSAAPAPKPSHAALQRWLLATGAVGLTVAREFDAPTAVLAASGTLVIGALVLLVALLAQIRTAAPLPRFHPAIDGYLTAILLGIAGSIAGVLLATGAADRDYARVRSAHLTVNLLGLVGLVIAATVPYFIATQARTKMSTHAKPTAVRFVVGTMTIAVLAAATGLLLDRRSVTAAAFAAYALGVVGLFAFVPRLSRRQLAWAGPRLLLLITGILWWAITTGLLAASAAHDTPLPDRLVQTLVIGGFAQILAASLAYLAPVLRGGGHHHLTQGFSTTRSWTALIAANAAALAALTEQHLVLATALVVWAVDLAIRMLRLLRRPTPATAATDRDDSEL